MDGPELEIVLFPSASRPGPWRPPEREGRRPLLPLHARHCAPLEAGSALGFLVYPALAAEESFQLERGVDGRLSLSVFDEHEKLLRHRCSLTWNVPAGGTGIWSQSVTFRADGVTDDDINGWVNGLLRLGSLEVPPGAVGVRGAFDFRTPPGWDTVYTGVLNRPEPPLVAALSARVETDWYPMETEFRYILRPGDVLSGSGSTPVGQVFFVPRTDVAHRVATAEESDIRRVDAATFAREKISRATSAALGMGYDTVYRDQIRVRRSKAV
jgi:hypothetical protein